MRSVALNFANNFKNSMKDKLSYVIATGFGSGYTPIAPGTAGSLFALVLYIIIVVQPIVWVGLTCILLVVGIWAASHVESKTEKDPKIVVIDEMVGQWVALLFLPRHFTIYIAAFLIFRVFDIFNLFYTNLF